jgi:hypothetical protein
MDYKSYIIPANLYILKKLGKNLTINKLYISGSRIINKWYYEKIL